MIQYMNYILIKKTRKKTKKNGDIRKDDNQTKKKNREAVQQMDTSDLELWFSHRECPGRRAWPPMQSVLTMQTAQPWRCTLGARHLAQKLRRRMRAP